VRNGASASLLFGERAGEAAVESEGRSPGSRRCGASAGRPSMSGRIGGSVGGARKEGAVCAAERIGGSSSGCWWLCRESFRAGAAGVLAGRRGLVGEDRGSVRSQRG